MEKEDNQKKKVCHGTEEGATVRGVRVETFTPRRDGFFLSSGGSFAADKVWWGRKRGGLRADPLYIRVFFI